MTRATKDSRLDSRTARAKLKVSGQPYYRQLDARLHLGYRKGKLGGRWVMRRRDGGRYAVETIGVADDLSDADGVEVLSYTQAQARVRTLAAQSNILGSDDASAPLRVSGAVENYLDWLDANRKAGKSARNRAANDILPLLGKLEVARLDTKDLRKWLQALAERPRRVRGKKGQVSRARVAALTEEDQRRRKSSANRTLTILKAALNRAFHEGLVASDNAWRSVKAFREADAVRLRYLSRDEAVRLVRAANEEFRPLVNAALLSGCRYGELTRLRFSMARRIAVRSAASPPLVRGESNSTGASCSTASTRVSFPSVSTTNARFLDRTLRTPPCPSTRQTSANPETALMCSIISGDSCH
jgi:cbb3-type cytochrome oxidase subunit 3